MSAPAAGTGGPADRRQYPRKNIIQSKLVTVDLANDQTAKGRGVVLDLSEGGMAVQPFVPLTPGATSEVKFDLAGAEQFKGTGLVAWVGPGGRAGIRFIDVPPEARDQLRRWLSSETRQTTATGAGISPASADLDGSEELDLDGALELIAQRAQDITAATGVAVALGDSESMICRISTGDAPDVGVQLQPDAGLSGICLRTGELVHCIDTHTDPRVDPAVANQLKVRSVLIVPVYASGAIAGLLEVLSAHPNAFEPRHVTRLQRIAQLLSGAIEETRHTASKSRVAEPVPLPPVKKRSVVSDLGLSFQGTTISANAVAAPAFSTASSSPHLNEHPAESSAPGFEDDCRAAVPEPRQAMAAAASAGAAGQQFASGFAKADVANPAVSATSPGHGKFVHRIGPVYLTWPGNGYEEVVLAAVITRQGILDEVEVVSGPQSLGLAAVEAVRKWRCHPYEYDGEPIEVHTTITIRFRPGK